MANGIKILKIGDFGIAKVGLLDIHNNYSVTLGNKTTPAYLAPEMMRNN